MAGFMDTVKAGFNPKPYATYGKNDVQQSVGNTLLDMVVPERKVARIYDESAKRTGEMEKNLTDWFNNQYNRDFMDTTMMRSFQNLMEQKVQENNQSIDNAAAVTGATNEAKLAGKSDVLKNFGDTMSKLSSQATQWKDNQYANYFSRLLGLEGAKTSAQLGSANAMVSAQQRMADNVQGMMDNTSGTVSQIAPLLV